jgi:hypothetical protein
LSPPKSRGSRCPHSAALPNAIASSYQNQDTSWRLAERIGAALTLAVFRVQGS